MHCAAQSYHGYFSILYLVNLFNFDVSQRDAYEATPLHYAILKREFMNVQLFIKFGADLDAQDLRG